MKGKYPDTERNPMTTSAIVATIVAVVVSFIIPAGMYGLPGRRRRRR